MLSYLALSVASSSMGANQLDGLFQQEGSEPGCAAGYAVNGEIQYLKGFGTANLEYGVPINEHTRFHVASVTKQFTAAAIGLLVLEGKVSLEDSVRSYLPEMPEYGQAITIEHLLQHTSGLKNHTQLMGLEGMDYGNAITQQAAIKLVLDQSLNFPPGEKFEYSSGYLLLARIVEEVTKMPFSSFVNRELLEPLNMNESGFHEDFSIIPNRAEGYLKEGDNWVNDRIRYTLVGSGGLYATIKDLLIWSNALRNDELTEGLAEMMFESPGVEVVPGMTQYNFGLFHSTYQNQRITWHSGSYQGTKTTVVNLEPGISVAIACNHRGDVEGLAWKMISVIAPPDSLSLVE